MDKILVAYGRASASTGLVGLAVGEQLSRAGFQVDVRPCSRAQEPTEYRAVIIGSAVHKGRWERSAVDYATRHAAALALRPTWLYQLADSNQPVRIDDFAANPLGSVSSEDLVTFDPYYLLDTGFDSPVLRLAQFRRRSDELSEWRRVQQWALLIANELPVHTLT